mmetsp:Transcript_96306/g.294573  ORF Transcript_96306/g.294573 Transcript_96306/m.294573 type:complete len:259 (+) Transcript_96306:837-1613(+)
MRSSIEILQRKSCERHLAELFAKSRWCSQSVCTWKPLCRRGSRRTFTTRISRTSMASQCFSLAFARHGRRPVDSAGRLQLARPGGVRAAAPWMAVSRGAWSPARPSTTPQPSERRHPRWEGRPWSARSRWTPRMLGLPPRLRSRQRSRVPLAWIRRDLTCLCDRSLPKPRCGRVWVCSRDWCRAPSAPGSRAPFVEIWDVCRCATGTQVSMHPSHRRRNPCYACMWQGAQRRMRLRAELELHDFACFCSLLASSRDFA